MEENKKTNDQVLQDRQYQVGCSYQSLQNLLPLSLRSVLVESMYAPGLAGLYHQNPRNMCNSLHT